MKWLRAEAVEQRRLQREKEKRELEQLEERVEVMEHKTAALERIYKARERKAHTQ